MEGHSSKSRLESNTNGNAQDGDMVLPLPGDLDAFLEWLSVNVESRTLAEYRRYALKLWDTYRGGIPLGEVPRLAARK